MTPRLFSAAIALALLVAGCPGTLEDPARFDGEFGGADGGGGASGCPDIPMLFATTCALASCHAASNPANGLDLASPNVYERLSGKAATGGPGLLVDPANPSDSVLYTKLTPTPPFGSRMPFGGTPLDDATVACVLRWIEASGPP
jgi:hypothetical protein